MKSFPLRHSLAAFAALIVPIAACGQTAAPGAPAAPSTAQKGAEAGGALTVPVPVRAKLQTFMERFVHPAPDRKVALEPDWRQTPPGFMLVRVRVTSSDEKFNENAPFLVSTDWQQVFTGQVFKVDDMAEPALGPAGAKALSKYLSEKAKGTVEVTVSDKKGIAGTYGGSLVQVTDLGRISMDSYVSSDGKWFMLGTFFPLAADPRVERMKRIGFASRPMTGNPKASVTIVEFSDYECPTCGQRQPDIENALEKWKGKVRLFHYDHPIWKMHEWALPAALGSRCMLKISPEAYWKYKHLVYERQKDIKKENFDEILQPIVESLGGSFSNWKQCVDKRTELPPIVKDLEEAYSLGINGTPTLLVNGTIIDFGIDKVLDETIAKALAGK
jgi:hypothetical protein